MQDGERVQESMALKLKTEEELWAKLQGLARVRLGTHSPQASAKMDGQIKPAVH